MKAFIIILNYKGWEDCIQCLKSVFASEYKSFTVIVIDNDSRNDSLQHIQSWAGENLPAEVLSDHGLHIANKVTDLKPRLASKLLFLQHETNLGFAGGINPVIEILQTQDAYVWLLNPDMEIQPDTLGAFVQFGRHHPEPSIVGGMIRYFTDPDNLYTVGGGRINFRSATVRLNKSGNVDLDYISGGCLFTSTSTFRNLGLLPEQYFLYWEETDFCYQAKLQGFKLLVAKDAICYDKISRSIGKNFLSDFYYSRNGLLFLKKYCPSKLGTAMFFMWIRIFKRLLSGRFDRAKGIYSGMRAFTKHNKNAHK